MDHAAVPVMYSTEEKLHRRRGVRGLVIVLTLLLVAACASGMPSAGRVVKSAERLGLGSQHFFILLDRTGSMSSMRDGVVDGINTFIKQQASAEGRMQLTMAQFDSQAPFEVLIEAQEIQHVKQLTSDMFVPRGTTPLYDAVAELINYATSATADEPQTEVVVVIFTDGLENASEKYTRERVFKMVEAKKRLGWTFVFLGANQDSYAAGVGNSPGSTSNYAATSAGARAGWADVGASNLKFRAAALRSGHVSADAKENYITSRSAEAMINGASED